MLLEEAGEVLGIFETEGVGGLGGGETADQQALGTVEFRLCETVLTGALGYANGTDDTAQDVILLTADANGERIFGTAEEE